MNKETLTNKSETLKLGIILIVCLIVLLVLSIAVVQSVFNIPASNLGNSKYIEIPNLEGMKLSDAKTLLDNALIQYEIVPTTSRTPNTVESFEYTGKTEGAKILVDVNGIVKLHANEVGKDKIIYLTFDDGPTRDNTNSIVFKLSEYGIKASFFVEGADVERYPDRMEAIFNRGHVIACHSFSHEYAHIDSSTSAFLDEVRQYENALIEAIGAENFAKIKKIIRFPGGTNNARLETKEEALTYISAVREIGYSVYDWTALTGDAEGKKDAQSFIDYLSTTLASAKNRGADLIVLMHDNVYTNEALGEILDFLVSEGYYFDTIDNCPEYTFVEN